MMGVQVPITRGVVPSKGWSGAHYGGVGTRFEQTVRDGSAPRDCLLIMLNSSGVRNTQLKLNIYYAVRFPLL